MKQEESRAFQTHFVKPLMKHFGNTIHIVKLPGSEFQKGLPDFLICLRGNLLLVEAKMWYNEHPYGTPLQRKTLRDFDPSGGSGAVFTYQQDGSFICKAVRPTQTVLEVSAALHVGLVGTLESSATAGTAENQ